MFESLLGVLEVALHLWDDKLKTKYQDKLMQLKKDYREEYNKPLEERSDAVLDNLRFELCILGDSFSASVREPNASN